MSLTVSLPPELLEQLHYIEAHTQQDLNALICKAIVREYEQFRSDRPNALELFEAAGLVGWIDEDIWLDLASLARICLDPAYELHDLAERYEPLNQEYLSLLNDFPGEGERLKFSPSENIKSKNYDQKDVEFSEAEILIQQLQRQIAQTSTRRDAK